jgi:hypothetical protein
MEFIIYKFIKHKIINLHIKFKSTNTNYTTLFTEFIFIYICTTRTH